MASMGGRRERHAAAALSHRQAMWDRAHLHGYKPLAYFSRSIRKVAGLMPGLSAALPPSRRPSEPTEPFRLVSGP